MRPLHLAHRLQQRVVVVVEMQTLSVLLEVLAAVVVMLQITQVAQELLVKAMLEVLDQTPLTQAAVVAAVLVQLVEPLLGRRRETAVSGRQTLFQAHLLITQAVVAVAGMLEA